MEPEDAVGAGEARVVLEDGARDERLAEPGRRRHRAPDEPVADRDDRVALEEVVRDRRQQEERVDRVGDLRVRLLEPLDEGGGELRGVEGLEPFDDGRRRDGASRRGPSRTVLRRSGSARTSSRRSCTSRTSAKRRRTCWNRRCSSRARAPCRMSSKRRSCIIPGVIRSISRPGWWTTTVRRRPISEWTAIGMVEPPWQPRENSNWRRKMSEEVEFIICNNCETPCYSFELDRKGNVANGVLRHLRRRRREGLPPPRGRGHRGPGLSLDAWENPLTGRYASPGMSALFSARHKFATWRRLWLWLAEAERELGLAIPESALAALRAHLDPDGRRARRRRPLRAGDEARRHGADPRARRRGARGETVPPPRRDVGVRRRQRRPPRPPRRPRPPREARRPRRRAARLLRPRARATSPASATRTSRRPSRRPSASAPASGSRTSSSTSTSSPGAPPSSGSSAARGRRGRRPPSSRSSGATRRRPTSSTGRSPRRPASRSASSSPARPTRGSRTPSSSRPSPALAASASKFAHDLRLLQHMKEVEEPFGAKQVGSSAMPYKRNPMKCERMNSLARWILTTAENGGWTHATQWLERTLDDSANRRLALAESFLAADALLVLWEAVATGLVVHPAVIRRRLAEELPVPRHRERPDGRREQGGRPPGAARADPRLRAGRRRPAEGRGGRERPPRPDRRRPGLLPDPGGGRRRRRPPPLRRARAPSRSRSSWRPRSTRSSRRTRRRSPRPPSR